MSGQAWLFLSTVLLGAGVGFVYDIFRIFRKTAPRFARRAAAVQLEDLFFWLCVTLGVFYFMLVRNFGEIRFFSVIGMLIGTVLYFSTLSRHVIFIFVHIINFLKKIIVLPFKLAHKWLSPILSPAYKKIRSHLRRFSRFGKIRLKKSARNWFIFRHKK
jgi:spore cortex biosynthesis protein YabQ